MKKGTLVEWGTKGVWRSVWDTEEDAALEEHRARENMATNGAWRSKWEEGTRIGCMGRGNGWERSWRVQVKCEKECGCNVVRVKMMDDWRDWCVEVWGGGENGVAIWCEEPNDKKPINQQLWYQLGMEIPKDKFYLLNWWFLQGVQCEFIQIKVHH